MEASLSPNCHRYGVAGQEEVVLWIATHMRQPWLTLVMHFITHWGENSLVLLTIALAYWLWNVRQATVVAAGMFVSLLLNIVVKDSLRECRPPSYLWLEDVGTSFSFPSGHVQIATFIWWGFAYYSIPYPFLSIGCILFGSLIAFSRLYLGIHYLHDVLGAFAAMLVPLLGWKLMRWCLRRLPARWIQPLSFIPTSWSQGTVLVILSSLLIPLLSLTHDPEGLWVPCLAGGLGFWLGTHWERASPTPRFEPPRSGYDLIQILWIGLSGLFLLWFGMNYLRTLVWGELAVATRCLQYCSLAIWITYGAPTTFLLLRERGKGAS